MPSIDCFELLFQRIISVRLMQNKLCVQSRGDGKDAEQILVS